MSDEYLNKNGRSDQQARGSSSAGSNSSVERTTLPDASAAGNDYQKAYSFVPPQPESQTKQSTGTWWKVLGGLFVGCLGINIVLGLLGVLAFSLMTASCVSSCSDSPIGDSREVASFISARESSKRDLEVFDALRGSIDEVYEQRHDRDGDGIKTPDELRQLVASGSWPDESAGYGDTTSPTNPQLWVRLAELSENYLEDETGEDWAVVDLAYPFPDNGPIPAPATRDEYDSVTTRLICLEGDDAGIVTTVDYWRWEQPARFSHELEESRTNHTEARATLQKFEELELVHGRKVIYSAGDFFLWDQGEDDPLRDPSTFVTLVNQASDISDPFTDVTLLAADAPIKLRYNPLDYDYPNERDEGDLSYEACREACLRVGHAFSFDNAFGDELLTGYATYTEKCELEDLYGTLAPNAEEEFMSYWRQPNNSARFDESLVSDIVSRFDGVTEDQVIAISDRQDGESGDVTFRTWLVLPRGVLPENADGFCREANGLRDNMWEHFAPTASGSDDVDRIYLFTRIYVIDEGSILHNGESISFAYLRVLAKDNLPEVANCSFEMLLVADP
ncbi:MAG: hypothetical protein IJ781_06210, partial [Atopobiaceae bacterium]|nr:hypothetical protein [Atopobiaceae bacterium]